MLDIYFGSETGISTKSNRTLNIVGGNFGVSVDGIGDVNKDGYDDVIVGDSAAWKAYVFYGAENMDTTSDVTLEDHLIGHFGILVAGAGDVNGDGYDNVILGNDIANSAYIYYSATGSAQKTRTLSLASSDDTTYTVYLEAPSEHGSYKDLIATATTTDGTASEFEYVD